jgi:hypothetical protein
MSAAAEAGAGSSALIGGTGGEVAVGGATGIGVSSLGQPCLWGSIRWYANCNYCSAL